MKKRITALALAVFMVLGTVAVAAGADKTITVTPMNMTVNGQAVTPLKSDGTPAEVFAYEGATYVPLRYLSELLGIEVVWDAEHSGVAQLVSDKLAPSESGVTVRTGLSWNNTWGLTIANVIEENGVVTGVLVDTFRDGLSSKEKYNDYNLGGGNALGEWWEELKFYENWVVENGVDAVAYDENGHATVPDLISGATINISNFTEAIKNATPGGVNEVNDLTVKTGTSWNDTWGITVANVILQDGVVTGVLVDTFRDGLSSKEKFDTYGLKSRSTLGKDWWEQVKFYENWVVENGVDAVAYDEDGHSTVDSLSGATINISNFTMAIKDALAK